MSYTAQATIPILDTLANLLAYTQDGMLPGMVAATTLPTLAFWEWTNVLPTDGEPYQSATAVTGGYWVSRATVGAALALPNIAALAALAAPTVPTTAHVATNLAYYTFEPTAAFTPDGVNTIAPASGSGLWIRSREGNDVWRQQATWYVDPVAGSNEANGATSGTPIATITELSYRLGGSIIQSTQVNLLNNLPSTDSLGQLVISVEWNRTLQSGAAPNLVISGQATTSRTGAATANATLAVPATPIAGTFTDSGVADWTADVGKILIVTSGAAVGAFCIISKDLTGGVAEVSRWSSAFGTNTSTIPSNGDTYKVCTVTQVAEETLPTLLVGGANASPHNEVQFAYLRWTSATGPRVQNAGGFRFTFSACTLPTGTNVYCGMGGVANFQECYFSGGITVRPGATATFLGNLHAGGVLFQGAQCPQYQDALHRGGTLTLDVGSTVVMTDVGMFGVASPLVVKNGSCAYLVNSLYGNGNTGTGTAPSQGGVIQFYTANFTPTLTASGAELAVDNRSIAFPVPTAGGMVPTPLTCNTWAIWAAAPFSRYATGMASGTGIFGVAAPPALTNNVQNSGNVSVASISALQALGNPGSNAYMVAWVQSNYGEYHWDSTDTTTADNILIVAPNSGSGRWVRTREGSVHLRQQIGTWYVDPTSGSDENNGTGSGTALKTVRELKARLGTVLERSITVNILNNLPSSDSLSQLSFQAPIYGPLQTTGAVITLVGVLTTVRTSTATSASVAPNKGAGTTAPTTFTDTTVTNWEVGDVLVMTSGSASGYAAEVMKDLGSGVCYLSHFMTTTTSQALASDATQAANGDSYKVCTRTTITGAGLPLLSTGFGNNSQAIIFQLFEFVTALNIPSTGYQTVFERCQFDAAYVNSRACSACYGCQFNGVITNSFAGSDLTLVGCGTRSANTFTTSWGATSTVSDLYSQGATIAVSSRGMMSATNLNTYNASVGLSVAGGYVELATACYGNTNTTGCAVNSGGGIRCLAAIVPTLTGTTELSGESLLWTTPTLSGSNVQSAVATMTSWATWSSNFSKYWFSLKQGSYIIGE